MTEILRPDQVQERYGRMFCDGFFTIVDERNGIAQVVEKCIARGPVEWDAVNRKRAGGVITDVRVDGHTLIMDAVIGEKPLRFGPVSAELGGQGMSALLVEGDRVRTRWEGLAGATVGIGACIPQSKDVIETVYPDNFRMGGAHRASVEIVTAKKVRLIIGADDTDTKEKGASWSLMMKLGQDCPVGRFLDHKIVQLNPKAPNKTTNCCSTAVSFAVKESDIPELVAFAKDYLADNTYSDDTVMTVFSGLKVPSELEDFGWKCKHILFDVQDAVDVASRNGVEIIEVTGDKGTIGAVAAIGCFDMGLKAAGLPEDVI